MTRDEIVKQAVHDSRDRKTRVIMLSLGVVAVVATLTALVAIWMGWDAKQHQVEAGASLAQKVQAACDKGELDTALCKQAEHVEKVVEKGPQGPPGASGPPGPQGAPGEDGEAGEDGSDGADGADGTDGKTGATGATGQNGLDGTNGRDGASGAKGEQGPTGPAGQDGAQGPQGDDAYPFQFTFEFVAAHRTWTCVVSFDNAGTQEAPPTVCTPADGPEEGT